MTKVSPLYTAAYRESWMVGNHRETLTKMKRIEQLNGESVEDMLKRENLQDSIVFLFHGHPREYFE